MQVIYTPSFRSAGHCTIFATPFPLKPLSTQNPRIFPPFKFPEILLSEENSKTSISGDNMMGKRKRGADINKTPPPSDLMQHHEEHQLKQISSDRPDTSATRHAPSIMDVTGSSLTRPQGHQSPQNQNHGASHGISLRHSRHYLDHNYSRRGSINHTNASPSDWKGSSVPDTTKLSFKLAKCRELMFHKLKRIRARSLTSNVESAYTRKMECGICQKRLRKKSFNFDNSNSSNELSVVGVLVCGHVYHADCLELKTIPEDVQDPPCPICKRQF